MNKIIKDYTDQIIKSRSQALEKFLKDSLIKLIPQIKGEVTKNRLKWRGIKLEIHKTKDPLSEIWRLKQRDKIIGVVLKI